MRKALLLLLVTLFAGCAANVKMLNTSFTPTKSEAGYEYFTYKAPAGPFARLDDADAEFQRQEWLHEYMADNGYGGRNIEFLNRRAIVKSHALFGDVYDVFYEVRVPSR